MWVPLAALTSWLASTTVDFDSRPRSPLQPAPFAFSIWIVLYAWLAVSERRCEVALSLLATCGWAVAIDSVSQSLWLLMALLLAWQSPSPPARLYAGWLVVAIVLTLPISNPLVLYAAAILLPFPSSLSVWWAIAWYQYEQLS